MVKYLPLLVFSRVLPECVSQNVFILMAFYKTEHFLIISLLLLKSAKLCF